MVNPGWKAANHSPNNYENLKCSSKVQENLHARPQTIKDFQENMSSTFIPEHALDKCLGTQFQNQDIKDKLNQWVYFKL